MASRSFGNKQPNVPHIAKPGSEIYDLRQDVEEAFVTLEGMLRYRHDVIVAPATFKSTAGKEPVPLAVGPLMYLEFTVNNDVAYQVRKVNGTFYDNPSVHIHWTKTTDANEQNKKVRWHVEYVSFASSVGAPGDGTETPHVAEVEDTYLDAGTTTRMIHETTSIPLVGVVAGHYLSLVISAVTPVGTPMVSPPGLFALDLVYREYINQ